MRYCIVTGADDKYSYCLSGLLSSLVPLKASVVVIDLGLTEEQKGCLRESGARVEAFSCPFDYPARHQVETEFPGFGAMLARPYLNEIVPGYDVVVWLDADAWAQQPDAITELVTEAERHGVAAVPEVDRGYFKFVEAYRVWDIETQMYGRCFGLDVSKLMRHVPVINSGVWAVRADCGLWDAWRRRLRHGLDRLCVIDDQSRIVEQAAFNVTIEVDRIHVQRFPATYNWLARLALPAWHPKKKRLVDPNPPHDTIRIPHLSTHFVGKTARWSPCP